MADLSTPYHRPPALHNPPPLLPPDTNAPATDDGPFGTRRVPAPSPGRPGLNRQNSMDFLDGEQGPDLSAGRRKVLKCVPLLSFFPLLEARAWMDGS